MLIEDDENITLRDKVLDILENYEDARNNDVYLILQYWRIYQGLEIDPNEAASILRNPETIRRTRQKLQEEGHYLPTENEVKHKRNK